jgi:hypothetical protein
MGWSDGGGMCWSGRGLGGAGYIMKSGVLKEMENLELGEVVVKLRF